MVASKYESIIAFSGAVDYQYNEYLDAYLLDIPS